MKVKELKNEIVIAELDPEKNYICLVNPAIVNMETLRVEGLIKRKSAVQIVTVHDVEKAVRFIEVPKPKKK